METILSQNSLYLRYELEQNEIQLQQAAIESKYFSADFKLVEYSLETGDENLDMAARQLVEALMEHGINFSTHSSPHVETFVTIQDISIQPNKDSKKNRVTNIHHFVCLDELSAEKLVNICVTKTKIKLSLTLFPTIDVIRGLASSLEHGNGHSFFTSNFSLVNLTL